MASVPWIAGNADHRIQFTASIFVTGTILRDPEVQPGRLSVQLVDLGSTPENKKVRTQSGVERNGSFRCGPGAPDLSELWIVDDSSDRLLWKIPQVAGHRLDQNPDPRLDPLDLRGQLHVIEVQCLQDDGKPFDVEVNFALTASAVEEPEDWNWAGTGRFDFLAAAEPLHLWVQAEGYKRTDLDVRGNPLQVVLKSGPRLRILLNHPELLDLSPQIYLQLSRMEGDHEADEQWIQLRSDPVDQALSVPGDYRMRLYLTLGAGNDWNWIPYPEEGVPLRVLDVMGAQEVRLSWTAAEVSAELARVRAEQEKNSEN